MSGAAAGGLAYQRFEAVDGEELVGFLAASDWPFHGVGVGAQTVRERVAAGWYDDGVDARSFWVRGAAGEAVGFVRLFELADVADGGSPLFDLRVAAAQRGRGVGRAALGWLTEYLFTQYPALRRIEGTTRQDNTAMRRAFRACGYVKEAHYREAWPVGDGVFADAVGYAVLRRDWAAGAVTEPDWDDEG